jgi:hypothetical protein
MPSGTALRPDGFIGFGAAAGPSPSATVAASRRPRASYTPSVPAAAFDTSTCRPSGVNLSRFGKRPVGTEPSESSVAASSTVIRSRSRSAAHTSRPSGLTSMASGPRPVTRVRTVSPRARSTSVTLPEPMLAVHARRPSADTATMCVPRCPVGIARSTRPAPTSTTSSAWLCSAVTTTRAAAPAGRRGQPHDPVRPPVLAEVDGAGHAPAHQVEHGERAARLARAVVGHHGGAPVGRRRHLVRERAGGKRGERGAGGRVEQPRARGLLLEHHEHVAGSRTGRRAGGLRARRLRARRGGAGRGAEGEQEAGDRGGARGGERGAVGHWTGVGVRAEYARRAAAAGRRSAPVSGGARRRRGPG